MSKADEMFEEEGFEKEFYNRNGDRVEEKDVEVLVYKLEPETDEIETQIEFYLEDKDLGINGIVSLAVFQAINAKVKELGWVENT